MTDAIHIPAAAPDASFPEENQFVELTADEARQIFDEAAWYYLGISGDEFLRRWDAGEWRNDPDHVLVMHVVSAPHLIR